jgi:hypothetical protein
MEKRVDIKLEEEVLKWAAIEAAIMGMSRRQYLARIITDFSIVMNPLRIKHLEHKWDNPKNNKPYEVEEI